MDRHRFLDELAAQRAYCAGRSPLYHEILQALETDAARSPRWLDRIEEAWGARPFAMGWEAVHLLLACLHDRALRGDAPELADRYPSCGGSGAGAGAAARAFLERAPWEFWAGLRTALLQTNEVARGVAWILPAAAAFAPKGLPFHLVELGTAAGLSLLADRFAPACRFSSPCGEAFDLARALGALRGAVLSRTGLDPRVRRLEDPEDRRWIRACVWADDLRRLARLDRAIDLCLRLAGVGAAPGLHDCGFEEMPAWLGGSIPPRPGEGLIVFNAAATAFLGDAQYARLRERMTGVLEAWEDRALWVECELPRGSALGIHELAVHRAEGGRLRTRVHAVMDARPREVRLLAA